MDNKKDKYKRRSTNKIVKPKNKTCKKFCKEVFLPERERVEIEHDKKWKKKRPYKPIKLLRKTNKKSSLSNLLENVFLKSSDNLRFAGIKIGKYDENRKYINVQKELNTNL